MKRKITDKQREQKALIQKAKLAAKKAVYRAIKSGQITKSPCESCGTTEDLHQIHEDYSKPLQVVWLCSECIRKQNDELEKQIRKVLEDDKQNWERYRYGTNSRNSDDI